MGKYTTYCVSGYWNDSGEKFEGMCVACEEWDGIEDAEDESIFFYLDGAPILGDHGEFTIVEIEE